MAKKSMYGKDNWLDDGFATMKHGIAAELSK